MAQFLKFLCIAAFASQASGAFWNDLRVTWGPTPDGFFTRLPRVVTDAVDQGWVGVSSTCENNGTYSGYRYKQPNNQTDINLIFDRNGIIAGIQALFAHEEIMNPNNPFRYDLVPMFQNETVNGFTYAVLTAYFVPPQSICTTGRTPFDLLNEGTGTGLWFQNGNNPNSQIDVPMTRPEAAAVGWTNCECFPGMGLHNFWQVNRWSETNCTQLQPTQVTFNLDEEMTGFIFQVSGPTNSSTFEHPPNEALYAIIGIPIIPRCIIDSNTQFGSTTMHIYMIDEPWTIGCQ